MMAKLVFLGTASALAYSGHENSFFVLEGENSGVLVDCAARSLQRLQEAHANLDQLNDLIITHFHPDHVSGLPNLLMGLWLMGRKTEFTVHGNSHAISRAQQMMDLFEWDTWKGMYPVNFHRIPTSELAPVLETPDFRILSSPVEHMIPTLGLRIECRDMEFTLAYSSDTNPIEATVRLASEANILIHEAAGDAEGHSTPAEAGEIAARAGVNTLYLIHYSLQGDKPAESLLAEAKKTFPGKVVLAEDLMDIKCQRG
jgi:ribonuclease Z